MNNWNASNYRQRTAQRLASIAPHWETNPDTGEEFYLRKVGSLMSSVLAGYMPSGLTKVAVEAWKEKGVAGLENLSELTAGLTPEQLAQGEREIETTCRFVQQACVIPLLSTQSPDEVEFTDEWREAAIKGLTEKDPAFDVTQFDPKELVLHPRHLDPKDADWLIKWAQGIAGTVNVKGGGAMNVTDIKSLSKKPGRRIRNGNPQSAVRKSA